MLANIASEVRWRHYECVGPSLGQNTGTPKTGVPSNRKGALRCAPKGIVEQPSHLALPLNQRPKRIGPNWPIPVAPYIPLLLDGLGGSPVVALEVVPAFTVLRILP